MRNVEIKAKVADIDRICKLAEDLSGGPPSTLNQEDTFYEVNKGRLKMRFQNNAATLVRYDRSDVSGPKLSNYDLLQYCPDDVHKAKELDNILSQALGTRGRVVKIRKLYMVGQTRVHIDTVENLGHFMELEVVLKPEQTLEEGQGIATDLQRKLEVKDEDLIQCAYLDLLLR